MQDFHTTVNHNGRLVIPAAIRKTLGLKTGDDLIINLSKNDEIIIKLAKNSLSKLQNMMQKNKTSLSDQLIKTRTKGQI